ncbi:MAG: family 78 glycoside hydrolase catalytic domain [Acidimicrobiales bacterium]
MTSPTNRPVRLHAEHLGSPAIGSWVRRPRLSWWLPPGTVAHVAYEVALGDGQAARVDAAEHVLVPWPFEPLRSRERVAWRVRVWTEAGPSDWSEPSPFEAGLLEAGDWAASWIEPDEGEPAAPGERPAWLFRHAFDLDATGQARLYATAHGIYETFLNGQRVGDLELTPGFTEYPAHQHVQTYDVTEHLTTGRNTWEVTLSDGWYRGKHGNWQTADGFGTRVAFLGQLEVAGTVIATGSDWEATTGPIVSADLMAGQVEDRRIEPDGWRPVVVADHGLEHLSSSPAPPVRRVEELSSAQITPLGNGRQIVDLGQNINGHVRLHDLGPEGTEVVLAHGEALDAHGDLTTTHIESDGPLGQVDRVTSAGRPGDVFEPRHTVHGFQFVRVDGHPHALTADDLAGVVVHTDLPRTGWFECSDERVNRFHEIADWSFRGNACDIPTDCPHRERQGWTGDWQIFVPTAAFLYDVSGFSVKWLRDLAAEQLGDGLLPNHAPDPRRPRVPGEGDLSWLGTLGSAGWGDAAVIVPWELYQRFGDREILEETWPMMRLWLEYAAGAARTKRHPARAEARPTPAPHEAFLWDGGWHWGEWCEPDNDGEPFYSADQGSVATAYLHHSAALAARIGRLLGHDDEAASLDALAAGALEAWRAEYLDDEGALHPDTQANHVRALAFGLVPDDLRSRTAQRLVELIKEAGTHLGTGFLATPQLLPVLAEAGHLDVAYELLLQDTPPSWLAMVERGATTVWEEWEGIDDAGLPHASLNHYSKGAVITFLHRYVAGIHPIDDELAYRRFRVAPRPGGGITSAQAALDSPRGRIESSWRIADGTFRLTVTVPPGSAAEVVLPDGMTVTQGPGTQEHACPAS